MRRVIACVSVLALSFVVRAVADPGDKKVGRQADGSVVTSTNQIVTPAGTQVEFAGRPVAVALSPDGVHAAVLNGAAEGEVATITVIDLSAGSVVQHYAGSDTSASFDGIAYSADGSTLYTSGASDQVGETPVWPGGLLGPTTTYLTMPGSSPYPGGIAVGKSLYVALNRNNSVGVVDLNSGSIAQVPVGNAPHSVVLDGRYLYVSDEGGRVARKGDFTNDSSGTKIVADRFDGRASTGTVSVIDTTTKKVVSTIAVGLHPTAMTLTGHTLFVANTDSDSVSVVDTTTRQVVGTIAVKPFAGAPYGSMPNGLAMLPGDRLAVTLGRNNAVAIYAWHGPHEPAAFQGMMPVGWYPAAVAYDKGRKQMVVVNDHGAGTVQVSSLDVTGEGPKMAQQNEGSVSLIPLPTLQQIAAGTRTVMHDNGWDALKKASYGGPAVAIPTHPGQPSLIKHVVYIIKENRTYDQIMGDDTRGNGDPALAQFGQAVTPNQHAIAQQFPLLDNFYDSGSLSADGHQWVVQANAPDYLEKAFGGFTRSYPAMGFDALTYLPSGFIWDNVLRHHKTLVNFAEYSIEPTVAEAAQNNEHSDIPSLDRWTIRDYPGFQLNISDQHRADVFLKHFTTGDFRGQHPLPALTMIRLPDDHTGGTDPNYPSSASEVSDNDLALGRIVQAISHSQYWNDTAIFVEEDDAQAGTDHVDGHRSTCFVISPYAKHGGFIDHTYYTQVNVVRTIEQILGLPPMNQLDLAASPMTSLFTNKPDPTPYDAVKPPGFTLAHNPPLSALSGLQLEWARAALAQDFMHTDAADANFLNHDIWYATKGFNVPYPGDTRVLHPWEVLPLPANTARWDD
jgi:YVTN family beta-propeller protein